MKPEDLTKNNLKYSLNFLKRFNALYYQGKPLSHQKIFNKYNVWIFFQNRIFFNDLRKFAKERRIPSDRAPSYRIMFQNFMFSGFGLFVSFVGLLSAILLRKKTLIYSIDRTNSDVFSNDARMDPIYEYLKSSRVRFFECLHTTFDLSSVKRFFIRKRWVFYIKSIDTIFYLMCFLRLTKRRRVEIDNLDLSSFEPEEKEYAEWLVRRYLSSLDLVIFKVRVLQKIVSWIGVKTLLSIDNTRDYWELILACRLNGIRVYTFQHGHFTKYHVGWLNDGSFEGEIARPDKLFVWSDFWKQELIRLGTYFPEKSIEIGGLKNVISPVPKKSIGEYVGVLMPYEVGSNKLDVKEYIDAMLLCGNIKILFKLRTDLDTERQIKEYGINRDYSPNLKFVSDVAKHMDDVDIVVGTYSTFLYDMIAYERPVALLETSSDFGEGLVANGLAEVLAIDKLCEKIRELASTRTDILKDRKERLFGKNPPLMYDTVRSLCSRK